MQKIIIDLSTNTVIGLANDGAVLERTQRMLDVPDGFSPDDSAGWFYDGQALIRDEAALLERAKAVRKSRIKQEASRLIGALDWQLERAQEREAAGWATLSDVDAVLAQREAIRRSSSVAEAAVDALADVASVQAFSWSVDVPVAAPRRLTQIQFASRFSETELQAIIAATTGNAALRAFWEKFRMAQEVNLDDPATQAGVQALEIAGLIGTGRAAVVLA